MQPVAPISGDKKSFLSNECNKKSFLNLLGAYLQPRHITVNLAMEEGNADVVIVRKALTIDLNMY